MIGAGVWLAANWKAALAALVAGSVAALGGFHAGKAVGRAEGYASGVYDGRQAEADERDEADRLAAEKVKGEIKDALNRSFDADAIDGILRELAGPQGGYSD